MTRTIETAQIFLEPIGKREAAQVPIMVWPDLREAHDAECNKGLARAEMQLKHPLLDFLRCAEAWDYEEQFDRGCNGACRRSEEENKGPYCNISAYCADHSSGVYRLPCSRQQVSKLWFVLTAHASSTSTKFRAEARSYHFARTSDVDDLRLSINVDTDAIQDFRPSLLVECGKRH